MKPTDAILAFVNRQIGSHALYRELLAHEDWRIPRTEGNVLPTLMVADPATAAIWAFSSEEAYQTACKELTAMAIGPVQRVERLDEVLIHDDPRVVQLVIDPSSPLTFRIQTDELASLRRMAGSVSVERAIKAVLQAGSAENRAAVKFVIVDGQQLFGTVQQIAAGVLMNPMGPRTFGFELPACRDIAAAG